MKIGVYAICLNEEDNVDSWLQACKDADSITVLDTGSADLTVPRLRTATLHKLRVVVGSIKPWRFDVARNTALALVPDDCDICFPLDLDERPCPGWREMLEAKWKPTTSKAFYTLQMWNFKIQYPSFLQNRIHRRHGYVWRYPCHEGLYPYQIREEGIEVPELVVKTYHDQDKDRSNYLDLLWLGLQENPNDKRMTHYYGRELYYRGHYERALSFLTRYLSLPGPPHPWELNENLNFISEIEKRLTAAGKQDENQSSNSPTS